MDIRYLGHSSFLIEAKTPAGKVRVVTDPFEPQKVGLPWRKNLEAALVLVSHEHRDHNFVEGVSGQPFVIAGPGEYEVKGVKVTGVPAFHDEEKGEQRGKNTLYSIEAEGILICHLGDLGHTLTEEEVGQIGKVDVLLIPVGGYYTIDAEKAMTVVNQLEPLIVVPMHFKVPGLAKGFEVLSEVDSFLKEVGQTPLRQEALKVEKNSLPPEMKVVVLEIQK